MANHSFDSYADPDSPHLKPGPKPNLDRTAKPKRKPSPRSTACVYKFKCGDYFYIGSTSNITRRNRDHEWRLKQGIHPSPKLQHAFNNNGEISCIILQKIKPQSDVDILRNNLRSIEQEKLDLLFNDPFCCNRSPNASGPNNGELMKNRWDDPEFREKMTTILKSRKGTAVSPETRSKMSIAKLGKSNPISKPVIVTHPDGTTITFPSGSDAARHLNVTQQSLQYWLTGKFPWPGTITGKPVRPSVRHLVGHSARFA